MNTFNQKLASRFLKTGAVCIGLDPEIGLIPDVLKKEHGTIEEILFTFNREIIDATADLALAYKPNSAFYEAEGEAGYRALKRTMQYLREHYSEIPVILDAKRADIGNTNLGYVKAAFDDLGADAVTLHPYLGKETLLPFLVRKDKGIFILVKTSNPGSSEFQNVMTANGTELYKTVAERVASSWNENGNCGVVVGATYPEELRAVREIVGDMPILIPGLGAQGGDAQATVNAGKNSHGGGMILSSSRGIIFASSGTDFADAARKATEKLLLETKV